MPSKTNKAKAPEFKAPILKDKQISYSLTGESMLKAAVTPFPLRSKQPATVRITHSNPYGPVDAEIFVRIGEPKPPMSFEEFQKEQARELTAGNAGWQKAKTVADEVWDDEKEAWIPRPKKVMGETQWQGAYEATVHFPPGKHTIDIKCLSPIEHIASVVFTNWEVNVE